MKLYDFTPAPNPRRVRIFLAEKDIEVENIQVNLAEKEQLSDAHKARNPTLDVPVLELDDGTYIHQVNAICRYIEETHPQNPLYGRNPVERAQVEAWNHQMFLTGMMGVADAYRNTTELFVDRALPGKHDYPQIPELAKRGFKRIPHYFNDMNEHFASNEYVVGDYFSIADITAFVTIDFAKWVKQAPAEEHTHLKAWYERIAARPSATA